MKAALVVIGIVAALVLGVVLVGYALPVAHTATRSVELSAPPAAVWATITDIAAYPSWRSDVDSVQVLAPVEGRQAWREHGGDGSIGYAMTATEPPTRLVTRIIDRELPFGGEWEYAIQPEGTGSRLTITERGEVYNPVFRFVSRFILGHTATIDAYLAAITTELGRSGRADDRPVTSPAG